MQMRLWRTVRGIERCRVLLYHHNFDFEAKTDLTLKQKPICELKTKIDSKTCGQAKPLRCLRRRAASLSRHHTSGNAAQQTDANQIRYRGQLNNKTKAKNTMKE
jgi:hypothetical protein